MLLWSYMGEGDFRCSLNLSPNVLEDSPMYSSSQSTPATMVSIYDSTLFQHGVLVFWSHQEVFNGGPSFTMNLHPKLLANVLDVLAEPCIIRYHYVCFVPGIVVVVDCGPCTWIVHLMFYLV